jgi:mono/diheme cytochrome c family protein
LVGLLVAASLCCAADAAEDGAAEYKASCASCHGEGGAGDGPAVPALRTRPPDLRRLTKINDGVFPEKVLITVIDGRKTVRAHGSFVMPVWGRRLSQSVGDAEAAKRIAEIVDYLRSIQIK